MWKWNSFKGWTSDISVNSYNHFAAVGGGGRVYGWDKELKRWKEYPGARKGVKAIAINADNSLFTCRGKIIERFIPHKGKKFKGKWHRIPGCCNDIDTNGFHWLVAIGCDKHANGYGIWWNLGGHYKKWKRILGEANNISLGSRGHIVVRNKHFDIFWKDNRLKRWIKTVGKAKDVTVSVGGRMVVIGTDNHVYWSKIAGSRPQWVKNNGMGYRISCWSWRNPMVVGMDHAAWRAILKK